MKSKCSEYSVGLMIFLSYTIFYMISLGMGVAGVYKYFSIFVYMQFIYTFFSWKKVALTYFDSYLLFVIALYVFTLGHSFLDLFDSVNERFSLIKSWNVTSEQYFRAEYLSLLFLLTFHFGAIHSYRSGKMMKLNDDINSIARALLIVGIIGCVFSFPFYIYSLYLNLTYVMIQGYTGLYDSENLVYGSSSYYRLLADVFVPSVICLLLYTELIRKRRFWIYGFSFIFICIPPLIIGNRTGAVIMCAIMLLIYSLFNKISYKRVLFLGIIGYFSLFLLVLVRNSRTSVEKNELSESIALTKETDNNPLISMLSEMGWSIYPIVKTVEIKKERNEQYLYGSSFLWSITAVMPNLFWEKHPAKEHADMSNWLTQKLHFTYGTGFSLIAEMYANFGIFGFVFMYLLSYVFVKLFRYSNPSNYEKNLIVTTVSIIFLWFTIRIVRNNFVDTIRFFVYYVCPFYLSLMYVFRKFNKHKKYRYK